MIYRYLNDIVFAEDWGRQMRFIAGPRQSGKTTLAKEKLKQEKSEQLYYLWDSRAVKNRYKGNELFFTEDFFPKRKVKPWLCFDEIHKYPGWKNVLKSIFDQVQNNYHIIVTGSAKLNILKKAGDSLAGRYLTFHLLTLILSEINGISWENHIIPETGVDDFLSRIFDKAYIKNDHFKILLEYSGFPEPFVSQNSRFHQKWQNEYIENIIKEDIASLTKIIDRENIFDLYNILPEMVGSPVSESSLASHIQVSPPTVKNYLKKLEDFYLAFSIRPYSKNIKRSLLRAGKYYLYDWSKINDPGARFENFVACELNSNISMWNDLTGENYCLFYIRNKQKQETDFLIVKNQTPWLLLEVKLSDASIDSHHIETAKILGGIPVLQVCGTPGVLSMQKKGCYRISADRFFGG